MATSSDAPVEQCTFLTLDDMRSIRAAIGQEIAAAKEVVRTGWLEIDAIQPMPNHPGQFVYRLVLSTPITVSPDQTLTFETRNPKDRIPATVILCDDEGLVVECEKPLPTDARLLSFAFDPSFILRALEAFIEDMAMNAGPITRLVMKKLIPQVKDVPKRQHDGLNTDQSAAVEEMALTPLHLLWGPPGTGKTTTLGEAISRWMRNKQRVLVVSTSNAAVDVAIRSVLKRIRHNERRHLLRLGTSLDSEVRQVTLGGKLTAKEAVLAAEVMAAQKRLAQIRDLLAMRTLPPDQWHTLFIEAAQHEAVINRFNDLASGSVAELNADVLVTGCTLAKMVLDKDLRSRRFDVVVLDEASMASLLYSVAASMLANSNLVYAGDPKQLPPIVQANGREAQTWFGLSIFDWLGVEIEDEIAATRLSLLRTQYRMTNQIGGLVSRLSYSGLLKHGRCKDGPLVEFIDVPPEWQTTQYSVREKSYYHLAAVPLIHALSRYICRDELLLLAPFRPQRSLLSALAFDLKESAPKCKITASTIHRAQGSECQTVVVDLTSHSPQQLVAFFRDKHCAKLFNVAISRAKDHLIVIGSKAMLRALASTMPFWGRVIEEFGTGVDALDCADVLDEELEMIDGPEQFGERGNLQFPAIYSHQDENGTSGEAVALLKRVEASRKLLVFAKSGSKDPEGDFIVRHGTGCPQVFSAGGWIGLPFEDRWIVTRSPNVSRVLWRVGFSHLADEEVDPVQAKRFFCPDCAGGELVLRNYSGEGWYLACNNSRVHECHYRRRLSLEDAKLKVRLQGMKCPKGHPMTARQGPRGIFMGCENYPTCEHTAWLSLLEGI